MNTVSERCASFGPVLVKQPMKKRKILIIISRKVWSKKRRINVLLEIKIQSF